MIFVMISYDDAGRLAKKIADLYYYKWQQANRVWLEFKHNDIKTEEVSIVSWLPAWLVGTIKIKNAEDAQKEKELEEENNHLKRVWEYFEDMVTRHKENLPNVNYLIELNYSGPYIDEWREFSQIMMDNLGLLKEPS